MLYSIRGKFADGHTFSAQVDGDGPQNALTTFSAFDDVKNYGQAIAQVSVIRMEGKARVRISDEPSKPRAKGAGRKPKAATPAPAPVVQASAANARAGNKR